jgi:hypothetical protein
MCTQIKIFVCEICDMAIERFTQSGQLFGETLPGEPHLADKVLLLMKTLYGMVDDLDINDFFL